MSIVNSNNFLLALAIGSTLSFSAWMLWDNWRPVAMIGFHEDMDLKQAHGFVWMQAEGGGLVKRPFIADRPELLNKPSSKTIGYIYHQVMRMGYTPSHIEVMVGNKTRVYKFGVYKPISVQPGVALV